jgi:2-C-methyl-D-erythritol 2,4-cyclodiphosphate synthase
MLRVGEGWDSHRLVEGIPLRIACVDVAYQRGGSGHSDGDAAAHALCDALLGAVGLGDIGSHFSPQDERWRGADSALFLAEVSRMLASAGARLVNADLTVVVEQPRLAPYISSMREALAQALGCGVSAISVKAKTAEALGPVGEGEAIEARAVVLVEVP